MNKYYALSIQGREASINIYGDITSWEWFESDVSSYTLSREIEGLDVDTLHVHINSYGGEVAEGLAIYNSLKRHKAKVITYADGFACSIASVIFMAGDERIMYDASLLMIHNAWTYTAGNADDLRKQADDLDTITQASINAYMSGVSITEDELKALLDAESWITPQDAVDKGFATSIAEDTGTNNPSQSAKTAIFQRMTQKGAALEVRITDLPEFQAKIDEFQSTINGFKEQLDTMNLQQVRPKESKQRKLFNFKEEK